MFDTSLKTTYKDLKPVCMGAFDFATEGLKTTYKDLKHTSDDIVARANKWIGYTKLDRFHKVM